MATTYRLHRGHYRGERAENWEILDSRPWQLKEITHRESLYHAAEETIPQKEGRSDLVYDKEKYRGGNWAETGGDI